MTRLFLLSLSILFFLNHRANAEIKNLDKSTVCKLLSEFGLDTEKGWHQYEYISWGCNSF